MMRGTTADMAMGRLVSKNPETTGWCFFRFKCLNAMQFWQISPVENKWIFRAMAQHGEWTHLRPGPGAKDSRATRCFCYSFFFQSTKLTFQRP